MVEFFSWRGRLNRSPYFFRLLVFVTIPGSLVKVLEAYRVTITPISLLISFLVVISLLILFLFQLIKRLHDMDYAGWYALLLLLPIFNIILFSFLLLQKGTDGPNKFGDDPLLFKK